MTYEWNKRTLIKLSSAHFITAIFDYRYWDVYIYIYIYTNASIHNIAISFSYVTELRGA